MSKNQQLLQYVSPDQIDLSTTLRGSALNKYEYEQVATNIIILARRNKGWFDFTWEEYKKLCSHGVTGEELEVLNKLVEMNALALNDKKYSVTSLLLMYIAKYVRE